MNDETGLFQAIVAEPENEALRLVYADLMEERGESPRAEFIRLQCRLARIPTMSAEREAQEAQMAKLLAAHRRQWNGPLHHLLSRGPLRGQVAARRAPIRRWAYGRGFVEGLLVQARAFLDHTDILFHLGPIQHVRLWGARPCIAELARCPHLSRLVTLSLRDNSLSDEDVRALAASPHLGHLTVLDVGYNPLTLASIQTLRAAAALRPGATLGVEQLWGWGVSAQDVNRAARQVGRGSSLSSRFLTALGLSAPATYDAAPHGDLDFPLRRWLQTVLGINV